MRKSNCWEVKKCGREIGGIKTTELGVCKAAAEAKLNGVHGGINAGRACWAVVGTLCGGVVQGEYAKKIEKCSVCGFYQQVRDEEDKDYLVVTKIFEKLK